MRSICAAFVLACAAHSGAAFTTTGTARTASAQASSALSATYNAHGEGLDRRSLFGKVAAAAAVSAGVGFPLPAFAAGAPPTEAEIQRIKTG